MSAKPGGHTADQIVTNHKYNYERAVPAVCDVRAAAGFVCTALSWQQYLTDFSATLLCRTLPAVNTYSRVFTNA